jgi:exoribonuclease R
VDDALHARALAGGGFEVGVHIADVSHFVAQVRRRTRRPARRSSAAVLGACPGAPPGAGIDVA